METTKVQATHSAEAATAAVVSDRKKPAFEKQAVEKKETVTKATATKKTAKKATEKKAAKAKATKAKSTKAKSTKTKAAKAKATKATATKKKATKKKATKRKAQPLYTTDAVRAYLHEIGRVPLLSHEDEIVLGKQVQKLMALLAIRDEMIEELPEGADPETEISNADWAKAAELTEAELNNDLRRGKRSKHKMIEANLRLVVAVAKKYQKRNLEFLDLIQEGTLGLERGVEKFDPMKGYKFSTYAYWWIRQAITRERSPSRPAPFAYPIHITEKLNKIKRVQRELSQKLGPQPRRH